MVVTLIGTSSNNWHKAQKRLTGEAQGAVACSLLSIVLLANRPISNYRG